MMAHEPMADSAPDGDQVEAVARLTTGQEDAASKRAMEKRKAKIQKTLNKELSDAMAEPLAAVEAAVTTGSSHEKAAAKQRRLALKEVLKMVSNPGMALEERLKYLQGQYVREVAGNTSAQQQAAALTAQLEERTQEKEAAEKEVLQLRAHLEDYKRRTATQQEASSKMIKALQDYAQKQADTYTAANEEQARLNQDLGAKNSQLLEATRESLDLVNKQKAEYEAMMAKAEEEWRAKLQSLQDVYAGIDERLKQQSDMGRLVAEAQEQLKAYSKVEQDLLVEKARNQQLQKALGEAAAAQKEMGAKYTKLIKQHGSAVDTVTKTHALMKTMSAELDKQRQALPGLLADRAAKEALVQQLAAAQEELGRTALANQRLQGLCRALQGRKEPGSADISSSDAQHAAADPSLDATLGEACLTSSDPSAVDVTRDDQLPVAAAAEDAGAGGQQQPQGDISSSAPAEGDPEQQRNTRSHVSTTTTSSSSGGRPWQLRPTWQAAAAVVMVDTDSAAAVAADAPAAGAAAAGAAQDAVQQCLEQAWTEVTSMNA